jgi:hypothetical protein
MHETTLTPSNVNSTQFGYLFKIAPGAGMIYAQPLVLHNFTVNGTNYCTVVFLATMNNQILAYRGDTGALIWSSADFGTASGVFNLAQYCNLNTGFFQAGILSTPYIDSVNLLMYFVTLNDTVNPSHCGADYLTTENWVYTLHAISLHADSTFGKDYIPPVDIGGTDSWGNVFTGYYQLQRPGILVTGGVAWVMFGFGTSGANSVTEDQLNYHGYAFGYKSCVTGDQTCANQNDQPCFSSSGCNFQNIALIGMTPPSPFPGYNPGHGGGIWMSGRAPATDGTYVAYASGNACYTTSQTSGCVGNPLKGTAGADYFGDGIWLQPVFGGGSIPQGGFIPADYDQGSGQAFYEDDYNDQDISTGGVLMIPPVPPAASSSYVIDAGKAGYVYLLSVSSMLSSPYNAPVQKFPGAALASACVSMPAYPTTSLGGGGCDEIHSLAFWNVGPSNANNTSYLYLWGFNDVLKGYSYSGGSFNTSPFAQGSTAAASGGALAVSSNGADSTTGILWAVSSGTLFRTGVLSAYQLWSGTTAEIHGIWNSSTSNTFHAQRYVDPVVSYGQVFVSLVDAADANGVIYVFGMCNTQSGGCITQGN